MQSDHNRTVYVDMDGVVSDFSSHFQHITGTTTGQQWDDNELWARINAHGKEKFFAEMPWVPGSKEMWNFITDNFLNVKILSALGRSDKVDGGKTAKGKLAWLRKTIPSLKETDILLVPNKHAKKHYAKPSDILIDDTEGNIKDWESKGGIGILFKTPKDTIIKLREYV